ncbi:MAG: hypothetical protein MJZ11_01620 [Lachnospiraceae bacterium]|nr:hypothetical protein [Lachnospiraceae bacterium]
MKKLLDKLMLIVVAFLIMAALAGIGWYIITADLRETERKNKEDPVYQKVMAEMSEKEEAEKEQQEKLKKISDKKLAEEKAIADFEDSVDGKYTKEYLLKKASSDKKMSRRLFKIGDYECMEYRYTSHNLDDDLCYDELSYYIFEDEDCAEEAFETMKNEWIDQETDSGRHYIQGWEADVLDAEVEIYIYQTDNMIITTDLQVVSGWAEPEDGDDGNSAVSFYYRKSFIEDNF